MATVSLREYGRQRGVSGEAVRKAIKAGRLIRSVSYDAKGWPLINPAIANEEWGANTSIATSAQQHQFEQKSESPASAPSPPGDDAGMPRSSNPSATYNQARAVKEAYLARLTKLDLDERSGLLVSVDSVKNEAFKIARRVRDSMLNIPDRISSELASETDAFKVHILITEEIRKALEALND